MVTSVAIREHAPGERDRARLQKGVWSQLRNSSFFYESDVCEAKQRSDSVKRRDLIFLVPLFVEELWKVKIHITLKASFLGRIYSPEYSTRLL